ncbi:MULTISPECIES: hypothetical protein [Mycolicibacterium]|uniref:hypothetical protein n=1 Tax=Mycolicibacterium TaxID=1866885 RepID=UPI001F3EE4D7|nr:MULTISPECIES: hypothetical protein [Mycolicibacterium]
MDSAVIEGTMPAVVVSAQELRAWPTAEVAATRFRSCGCSVEMFPRAHRPNRRVQAHFATKRLRQHTNCTLVEETAAAGVITAAARPAGCPCCTRPPPHLTRDTTASTPRYRTHLGQCGGPIDPRSRRLFWP